MSLCGLDIGSTGAKVTVVDEAGRVLHTGYRDYPVQRLNTAHEVQADSIWEIVLSLLRAAAAVVPDLYGIGITSFGESFALLDEQDNVLVPSMLYTDPRGDLELQQLSGKLGPEKIADITGTLPHPMFSLPKLMWIKKHKPDVFCRAKHICLMADFIAYKLTGQLMIDYSLATRTMGFNIHKLAWSQSLLQAADIDPALFSRPVPSGTRVGEIKTDLARKIGLSGPCHVVLSGQDQIAACLGSHTTEPGHAANGSGTVECITPVFERIPDEIALQKHNYSVIPFLNRGYCCYAFSFTGGSLIEWFLDQWSVGYRSEAKAKGTNVYQELELAAPDAPTGILVLPHFAGAATPYMDTGSKGAILGLDLSHSTSDLFRAILEGITYEMKINLDALSAAGIKIEALNASGGGSRSRTWLQMKADILNKPINTYSIDEAGTAGSILLTGLALGLFDSLETAADELVKIVRTYTPRPDMTRQYNEHYQRYRQLYETVRPLMEDKTGNG